LFFITHFPINAAALCWPADKVHLFTFPLFYAAVIVATAMAKKQIRTMQTKFAACSLLNFLYVLWAHSI